MRFAVSLMLVVVGIGNPGSELRDPGSRSRERSREARFAHDGVATVAALTRIPGFVFVRSASHIPHPGSPSPEPGSRLRPGAQRPLGAIRGRVDIKRVVLAPERSPDVAGLSSPRARELPDRTRAVVYLETAPAGAFEDREPRRARMDQRNETFLPHVLAVEEGTVVDFPNNDSTYHNVFSLSKPKRFDLGRYARGRSRAVRFDRPGIVRVFCDIHSHMSAFVLVFSHPYYASTEGDGRYRIDNIPPGTYTVSAWHEGSTRDTRTVTIPPQGGPVDLDFLVQ
jgi:plastocyanin